MTFAALHHARLAKPAGREADARSFYAGGMGVTEVDKPHVLAGRGGAWFRAAASSCTSGSRTASHPPARPGILVTDLDNVVRQLAAARQEANWDSNLPGFRRVYAHDPFGNRLD